MLLPDYLDKLPESLVTLFQQAEEDILEDMARRILKTGKLTDSAQWQVWRLEQLGEGVYPLSFAKAHWQNAGGN